MLCRGSEVTVGPEDQFQFFFFFFLQGIFVQEEWGGTGFDHGKFEIETFPSYTLLYRIHLKPFINQLLAYHGFCIKKRIFHKIEYRDTYFLHVYVAKTCIAQPPYYIREEIVTGYRLYNSRLYYNVAVPRVKGL